METEELSGVKAKRGQNRVGSGTDPGQNKVLPIHHSSTTHSLLASFRNARIQEFVTSGIRSFFKPVRLKKEIQVVFCKTFEPASQKLKWPEEFILPAVATAKGSSSSESAAVYKPAPGFLVLLKSYIEFEHPAF
jgi:hypothetical protein